MIRASMKGPILVVEGDLDVRLYRKFALPVPHSRTILSDGKPVLCEAMRILDQRQIAGVLGICDADFDRILSTSSRDNVLYSDHHDAEIMIAYSDAFGSVMAEVGETLSVDTTIRIRDSLLGFAATIGRVRIWNKDNDARLSFRRVDPGLFITTDLTFDLRGYIASVLESSTGRAGELETLLKASEDYYSQADVTELAVGHDFVALLDAQIAIEMSRPRLGSQVLGSMMRLAFDAACFRKTNLCKEVMTWEDKSGFDLLIDDARVT